MTNAFKILTIVGSPNDAKSNTRAFAEDFVEEMSDAGLNLTHRVISLGTKTVLPCNGCWACTRCKACPIKDDLPEIKQAMLDCDMLILASPVYTNQVSAQMKALFDRLFTWCHTFPLLGKTSLSLCTTANDGHQETGAFLEKMLATYGTHSFGTVHGTGAYTPGFFPRRQLHREKLRKLARKVAATVMSGKRPAVTRWQNRMFKVMRRKMTGVHAINYIVNGPVEGQPDPPRFLVWMIRRAIKKKNIPSKDTQRLSRLMQFELAWWRDRGWLNAKSMRQLLNTPVPDNFSLHSRLLPESV